MTLHEVFSDLFERPTFGALYGTLWISQKLPRCIAGLCHIESGISAQFVGSSLLPHVIERVPSLRAAPRNPKNESREAGIKVVDLRAGCWSEPLYAFLCQPLS